MTFELGGGFASTSIDSDPDADDGGEVTISSGRLLIGVHGLIGRVVSLGATLDTTFGTGAGTGSFFGVAGFALPSESVLLRLAFRVGAGDRGAAYGFEATCLGRSGRLLAGGGLTGTWTGDPTLSTFAVDLRIGTWF